MTFPKQPRAAITGAAGGFGRALALTLAKRGAPLVLSDIDLDGLDETRTEAARLGAKEVRTLRVDVRDAEQVEAQAALGDEAFGGTDIVVNNAGVAVVGPVGDVTLEDWRWQIDINLWGVIHGCHSYVPRMKRQGAGFVLNVASSAGLLAVPRMAPYNVTKAGVIALSETLAGELFTHGIRVSALCPTFFRTNIHSAARASDPRMAKLTEKLVTRSKWSAEQIAEVALRGLARGQLYIVPQADGQLFWRAKRLMGAAFYDLMGRMWNSPRMRASLGEP